MSLKAQAGFIESASTRLHTHWSHSFLITLADLLVPMFLSLPLYHFIVVISDGRLLCIGTRNSGGEGRQGLDPEDFPLDGDLASMAAKLKAWEGPGLGPAQLGPGFRSHSEESSAEHGRTWRRSSQH